MHALPCPTRIEQVIDDLAESLAERLQPPVYIFSSEEAASEFSRKRIVVNVHLSEPTDAQIDGALASPQLAEDIFGPGSYAYPSHEGARLKSMCMMFAKLDEVMRKPRLIEEGQ
jgi:hypothetical protein